MFFTWMQGGILCVLPEEESLIPFDYIQREKITFWNSVPTVAIFMHKMGYLKPGCFPDLTHSMFCGEQFPQHIGDAWRKAAPNSSIENLYGPTEATIYISRYIYTKIDEKNKFKNGIVPIGRPFLSHDVAIIGDDSRRASPGKSGEIVFTGPQITRGYLHDKEKTDRVFVSFDWDEKGRTWYKTGDLGFINSNGDLECIGRIDNQVKLAGRRIELGEIEAALRKYPQLQDAVVVPIFDEAKVVCACVAFTTNLLTESNETSIRKDIVQYLERVFFPKKIIHIELFPTTESGKTDRKTLAFMAKEYFPVVPSAS
jgi:acyl-coenzyme A synthetase/AMP-(fatty) acid ligase